MSQVKEGNIHEVEPSPIIQVLIHALNDDKDEYDSNGDGSVVPSPEYTQSTVETKAKMQLIVNNNSAIWNSAWTCKSNPNMSASPKC